MRVFVGVALAAIMLSGCASMPDQQRIAAMSAGAGAATGAAIGAAGGGGVGAIAGAAAGAAAGDMVGYFIKPGGCYFRNRRGEVWRVPCQDRRVLLSEACFRRGTAFAFEGDHNRDRIACPRVPLPR